MIQISDTSLKSSTRFPQEMHTLYVSQSARHPGTRGWGGRTSAEDALCNHFSQSGQPPWSWRGKRREVWGGALTIVAWTTSTKKMHTPSPKIDECLDTLSGATLFSTLDLQSGYWQIAMAPEDQAKTAFITRHGLFEYTRLPFGLCNAPGTFQRATELAMRGLQWKTILIYLRGIIIISSNVQDLMARLAEVLRRLLAYGLKLKPGKCRLLQDEFTLPWSCG